MEQTGKEVRLLLQKKLNEVRQKKGIKLSDMNLTDEDGKSLSEAQKSMLFSGKRHVLPHLFEPVPGELTFKAQSQQNLPALPLPICLIAK